MKIESFRACVSSLRGGDRSRMRCSIGTKGLLFFLGALVAFLLERRKPKLAEEFTLPVASGVLAGGSLMCGAGVLGQRRQHSQDALRRLTGHRAVVVTPPTAATTTRHLLDGPQTNLLCPPYGRVLSYPRYASCPTLFVSCRPPRDPGGLLRPSARGVLKTLFGG